MSRTSSCGVLAILALATACAVPAAGPEAPRADVGWAVFLAGSDPTWARLTDRWQDGAFTGNGLLGTMTYRQDDHALRFRLGRSDVTAHYRIPFVDWSIPRIPIGDLLLATEGAVVSESMRLRLYDAEVTGEVVTDRGTVAWRVYTHAVDEVIVLEARSSGGEQATLSLAPIHGISPRIADAGASVDPADLPPEPACTRDGAVETCVQPLQPGGDVATAWRVDTAADGTQVALLSIADGWPDGGAAAKAGATVQQAATAGPDALVASHRAWWHAYWPASFLSIPDGKWQAFYWIQMYKHASATRPGRPLIDNQGPWLTQTPWPGAWWNLNVELSYSPVYAANRLDQGRSLFEALAGHVDSLKTNAAEWGTDGDAAHVDRYTSLDLVSWSILGDVTQVLELGNLTWALHDVWRQWRTSMDEGLLRDTLFPLLRLSVNLYLKMLQEGDDGRLHLPPTRSPEFGDGFPPPTYADCTYAISLMRWGCGTLLDLSARLGIQDPLADRWRDVLARTVLPVDADGLRVGAGQPFDHGHRHFSHLLAIHPLGLLDPDVPADRTLIQTSLDHWLAMGARDGGLEGYSWTAASSMASRLGDGDRALGYLERVAPRFDPATMYVESGPVIETPLSAAQSIHDLLLGNRGGAILVFPAAPSTWLDVAFHELRAEGAFLVSAARRGGKTAFVGIRSLAGEPCRVRADLGPVARLGGDLRGTIPAAADGSYALDLAAGQWAVLYRDGEDAPDTRLLPVQIPASALNPYGLKPVQD